MYHSLTLPQSIRFQNCGPIHISCSGHSRSVQVQWTSISLSTFPCVNRCNRSQKDTDSDEDIPGLQEEFNSVVPATVQFACKSWCLLVCRVVGADPRIISALDQLVRRWLPHWIAAMGIMGEVDDACLSLHQVEQWMVRIQASSLKMLMLTVLCSMSTAV